MNRLFLNWEQSYTAGVALVGGKGWNLGRLQRYGFPVPVGGVLSAEAYDLFVQDNQLGKFVEKAEQQVTIENLNTERSRKLLDDIRDKFRTGTLPARVIDEINQRLKEWNLIGLSLAVRSSATLEDSEKLSFAGMHDSFLNVSGLHHSLTAITEAYASLWSLRAVGYRRKMKVSDMAMKLAVVVMKLVPAQSSGIAFSCNPQNGRRDMMVIQANYGYGESVVSGRINPDEYQLPLMDVDEKIWNKTIGLKEGYTSIRAGGGMEYRPTPSKVQVLSDERIIQLGYMVSRIHEALGEGEIPQDIEWVYDGDRFHIVQSRPVTAIPKYTYPELKNQPEIWSNGNFRDALPMVQSPLNRGMIIKAVTLMLSSIFDVMQFPTLMGRDYGRLYNGRAYFNLSIMQWEYFDAIGLPPAMTSEATGGHQPEIEIPPHKKQGFQPSFERNWRVLKMGRYLLQNQKQSKLKFEETRAFAQQHRDRDLRCLSEDELITLLYQINNMMINMIPTVAMLSVSAGYPLLKITEVLKGTFPGREKALGYSLLIGKGQITTAEQGYRLMELADIASRNTAIKSFFESEPFTPLEWKTKLPLNSEFRRQWESFLEEYGHRAIYEADIINPRWRDDPGYLLEIIRRMIPTVNLELYRAKQAEKYQAAKKEIQSHLGIISHWKLQYWLKQAIQGSQSREMGKSEMVRVMEVLQRLALEIGRRFTNRQIILTREDIYYCTWQDIITILKKDWNGQGLMHLIDDRKERKKYLETLHSPDYILDEAPQRIHAVELNRENNLEGIGVSSGIIEGVCRLLNDPSEGSRLLQGDILVAPSTDPGWTPLFLIASGLVMETGGYLSHGAIVAREYGIPAVVNIPGIMHLLKDGQRIIVNGDEGFIHLQ